MNVTSVVNHYPTANKGFITTLGSTISAGAVTVPLTSVSGLTNGTIFVGLIEPGLANEQEFTGVVDTAGVQITGVKWTDGTNVDHTAGVTIVDYVSATGQNMQTKGHLVSHDQDGSLKAGAVDNTAVLADAIVTRPKLATAFASEFTTGWNTADLPAVSSVTNNGNRSYDITFASTVAALLSPGMRLRTTRTVTAPTQCADLEASSSQYFSATSASLAGMTFTDDFTCSAWIRLESYTGASQRIVARYTTTTAANGYSFHINSSGQLAIEGGAASVYRTGLSYQSIPLGKWVHVAGALNMSANTAELYIDGVLVPSSISGAATALVQAGDLCIGNRGGSTEYFDGKVAQVAVFSSVLSASTIRSYMSQGLSGGESTLVSAFSCNNTLLDLNTTNNNDLTANGGALMTATDSPFGQDSNGVTAGTTDYALVMKVSTTTATVQVPEGCTIPTSGGVTSVAYSVQGNPYGWPRKTYALWETITQVAFTTTATPTVTDVSGHSIAYTATGTETIRLKFKPQYVSSTAAAGQSCSIYVRDGATTLATKLFSNAGAGYAQAPVIDIEVNPTVGAHTFTASASQSAAGTLAVNASVGGPTLFSLEVL